MSRRESPPVAEAAGFAFERPLAAAFAAPCFFGGFALRFAATRFFAPPFFLTLRFFAPGFFAPFRAAVLFALLTFFFLAAIARSPLCVVVGEGRAPAVAVRERSGAPRTRKEAYPHAVRASEGTDRRGFLRWALGATALALGCRDPGASSPAVDEALAVHRATRNTRLGSVGTRVRASRSALRPWKPYPERPRVRLPEPTWTGGRGLFEGTDPRETPSGAGPLASAELSRLLHLTNGITRRRPGGLLRAAPSAGALYAGEVYVVAARVEGLPPGPYYYGVRGHALVALDGGGDVSGVAAALERPGDAAGALAALLLTNVFARYGVRYANRGYRYALIDSGHIGENLRLAAGELGLGVRSPRRFEDDALNALLGVDGEEEAVCAVHLVSRGPEVASGGPSRALRERGPADPARASGDPRDYHAATRLVPASRAAPDPEPGAREPDARGTAAPRDPDAPSMPVHAAIRVRRSAMRFAPDPVALADLRRILAFASAAADRVGDELALHLVAHRVAGLAPGHYRVRGGDGLDPLRTGSLAGPLVEACLGQAKAGEAAVAVIAVAQLAEAVARGGARRYRDLLLAAGATAQRLYLGAEAHRLAARNLAAYYDDELDALLGLDGAREVSVHLTALGPGG